MILFKDLDWYQQCIYKMEYFLKEIEILKQKESFELFDQIRLNTLLNIIKSPMEYATLALTKSVSNKSNAFVPFRKNNFDDKNFRKIIKEKIGYVDDDIFSIYNRLFVDDLYKQFNDMHNYEKHTQINTHIEYITENTGYMELPGNIIINNNTNVRRKESNQNIVTWDDREMDISNNDGYTCKEELYFEYNDKEVFNFLDEVFQMVNNLVIDIKEYIENRSDEHG
ncbi:hypothetical protein CW747_02245 [Staphylococcus shinii]|uniref:hypothetical protein n=1 Tax=Staphylococcus shinii TaxID=2912228 RepID=UPI000C323D54|nr:hypothetical protein [Staphylococcus shinii]PKI10982.1 hypothetical protein CW747_02245 [Staphylococcus shinii]